MTGPNISARLARLEAAHAPTAPDACGTCGAVERLEGWRLGGIVEAAAPWCPACGSHDYAKLRAVIIPRMMAAVATAGRAL